MFRQPMTGGIQLLAVIAGLAFCLCPFDPLVGQQPLERNPLPGDSIRVRTVGSGWIHGRFVQGGNSRLTWETATGSRRVRWAEVERLDVWRRRGPTETVGQAVGTGMLAGMGGWLLADAQLEPGEELAVSWGTAAGIGAGIGFVAGVVALEFSPGEWKVSIRR